MNLQKTLQNRCHYFSILLFLFTLLFFSHLSNASEEEYFTQIQATAEQYVLDNFDKPLGSEVAVQAASLDSRLKIGDCSTPLQVSSQNINQNNNNVTVLIQCEEDWKVYVPVRITISMPLITAARSLAKGEIINANDIDSRFIELRQFRRYGFSAPEQVIGSKVKKNIKIGDILEQNDVCTVCRNEKVIIKIGKGEELNITTKGTALSDGSLGEQIKVRNDKSQRILEGSVTAAGEVTISF